MRLLSHEQFRELLHGAEEPTVSIFLPTEKAGKEVKQNAIRLKNLLRVAEERLLGSGVLKPSAAAELLAPARRLVDDGLFWNHQREGLALFASPSLFRYYRLPIRFDELVVVDTGFYVKPLLRLFSEEGRFYVLTLSRKQVRLFESTRFTIHELELGDTPTSFVDVVGSEMGERHLQWHTGSAQRRGKRAAHFHGQAGAEKDLKPELLRRFLIAVERGVQQLLQHRQAPLVLAGADDLVAIYREVSSYPLLVDEVVRVNPASLGPDELRDKAWAAAEPALLRERRDAAERFRGLMGTGRASDRLEEILPSAESGRAEVLFVPRGVRQWGTYDTHTRQIELEDGPRNGNRDLLDLAAVETILHGGKVYVVEPAELPGTGGRAAALFRH